MKAIAILILVVGTLISVFLLGTFTYSVASKRRSFLTIVIQIGLLSFSAATGLIWLWIITYIAGRNSYKDDRY